jgi:cytoskeleton protein RodZ
MNTSDNQAVELDPAEELAEPPSGSVRRSPGAMLSAQRETLELSIQQVADQLNLTMHFVRALETDCYDKLPGEVFVRGYIRAYSNLLRLDPVQVLAIFDEFTSQKIARKEEAIKRRDRRRQDKNRPWIMFSGFAFVAVAVGLWYLNPAAPDTGTSTASDTAGTADFSVLSSAPLQTPVSTDTQRVEPAVMADITPANAAVQEFSSAEPATSAAEQLASTAQQLTSTADQLTPTVQQLTSVTEPDAAMAETLTVSSVPLASASVAVVSVSSSAQAQMTEGEGANAVQVTAVGADDLLSGQTETHQWSGSDELTLEVSADCWVEVEHIGGEESYRNQISAGDTLVIRGTAPFSVLLGNARDVALTFNGRIMDISSNVRADNTARLSIGM